MPLIFEQQPRESNKAFAAFSLYLSLGPERSTREVGKKLGKSEGLIERWAARFDWPARAIAAAKRGLDAYMEREKVYANLADIARMLEIASKLGRLATGLGDGDGRKADDLPTVRVEVTLALEKIYGVAEPPPNSPAAAVVDVEEVKP